MLKGDVCRNNFKKSRRQCTKRYSINNHKTKTIGVMKNKKVVGFWSPLLVFDREE